jgi:hypothetical protein
MRATLWIALLLVACAGAPPPAPFDDLVGRADVVTRTNLHPDEARARLFTTNYQQDGLIPVCASVTLLERNAELLRFRVEASGKTYEYYYHKAAGEPFPEHLARVFGTECPRAELDALPEIDQRGLSLGKPLVGMSKQGVLFALGYPPRHVTPSLDALRWIYWLNRFDRIAVIFDDGGHVVSVQN